MSKKVGVLVVVTLVTVVVCTPVLVATAASGGGSGGPSLDAGRPAVIGEDDFYRGPPQGRIFVAIGNIRAIEDALTIQVFLANKRVRHLDELTVQLTPETDYRVWTPTGCIPGDFDALGVDVSVNVRGLVAEDVYYATRVTVGVPIDCCSP